MSLAPIFLDASSFELADLLLDLLDNERLSLYFGAWKLVQSPLSILLSRVFNGRSFVRSACTVPVNGA